MLGIPLRVVLAYIRDIETDRWNIAPREKVPPPIVQVPAPGEPITLTDAVPWGISLPDRLLINAKMESAKVHAANLTRRRCLIPAHGYYEWYPVGSKSKVPRVLHLPGDELFFFAGLWGPNVKQAPGGAENGFVIMTGEPGKDIAWLHNRMPLVVPPASYETWLNKDLSLQEARVLLVDVVLPYSQGLPWVVEPITPLPSGKGAGDIPEPKVLPPVAGTPLAKD